MRVTEKGRRICFIITSLRKGGAEGQLVRIAKGLAANGWQVEILLLIPENEYDETLSGTGIEVLPLVQTQTKNPIILTVSACRALRKSRPSHLVTFLFHADVIGRVAGYLTRIPAIIVAFRNERFGSESRDRLLRMLRCIPSAFVANFANSANTLVNRRLAPASKLHVIRNIVALPDLHSVQVGNNVIKRMKAENRFVWLFAGRLERAKGLSTLLQALATLDHARIGLVICGQGRLEEELRLYRDELGLSDSVVQFLGFRTDISDLMQQVDGFVLPSLWEGMPNALLEAQMHYLPAVATDVGGVSEILLEGKTGYLVMPDDAQDLAAGMARLMSLSHSERNDMGRAARVHIETTYSTYASVAAWEQLLNSVLN